MQVQLKRRGDDEKYMARVLAIGTECDLALLSGAACAGLVLQDGCINVPGRSVVGLVLAQ